jgi:hypothetical protein
VPLDYEAEPVPSIYMVSLSENADNSSPKTLIAGKKGDQTLKRYATLPDEEKTVSRWPWEEEYISAAEYQCSLEGLQRFVEEVEVNRLHTLEDLSAVASIVGHDLFVFAVTHGKKSERKTEQLELAVGESISRIEREYVFARTIGRLEIVVTARNGHSLLSRYKLLGFHGYPGEELSVSLPSDRDIAIGEKPNVDEHSMYAKDLRWRGKRVYHPTQEPESPEIQQVFARLLNDALSTLREVVSELA